MGLQECHRGIILPVQVRGGLLGHSCAVASRLDTSNHKPVKLDS